MAYCIFNYFAFAIASFTADLNASDVTVAPDTLSTPSVPFALIIASVNSGIAFAPISSVSVCFVSIDSITPSFPKLTVTLMSPP